MCVHLAPVCNSRADMDACVTHQFHRGTMRVSLHTERHHGSEEKEWKKELCKASVYLRPSEARVAERQELTKATATAPTFVAVALPASSLPLGISSAKSGTIDILIAGGRTVRVGADVARQAERPPSVKSEAADGVRHSVIACVTRAG